MPYIGEPLRDHQFSLRYNQFTGTYETSLQIDEYIRNKQNSGNNIPTHPHVSPLAHVSPLPQIPPPPLVDGVTPIEELRNEFIKNNPGTIFKVVNPGDLHRAGCTVPISNLQLIDGKVRGDTMHNWFYYVYSKLKELQKRCEDRVKLPEIPTRISHSSNGEQSVPIWATTGVWDKHQAEAIYHLENYYSKCRIFELNIKSVRI